MFLKRLKNQSRRRIISAALVGCFLVSIPVIEQFNKGNDTVWASPASDAQDSLDELEEDMEELESQKANVDAQVADAAKQLKDIMDAQSKLESDIQEHNAAIEQAEVDLAAAIEKKDQEYEAMKLRIQFMYENSSSTSLMTAFLESDGIADMLNRIEYANNVYEMDRQLLENYKNEVQRVEELTAELETQRDEMLALQESYLGQQAEMESLVATLQGQANTYASQIAEAKRKAAEYQAIIDDASSGSDGEDYSDVPAPSQGTASGREIVNYALQFVGNPYVWGGNSLTNGCDCSGFVHLVYKHFGYSVPRYSMAFQNAGWKEVAYADMQPGDIVVYEPKNGVGHVAIYIGNGCIVEAQSAKAGITSNRKVNCRGIIAIRRVVKD